MILLLYISHFFGPFIHYWAANFYFSNQILLFVVANESSKFLPIFKEASKSFKGKVVFFLLIRQVISKLTSVASHALLKFGAMQHHLSLSHSIYLLMCSFTTDEVCGQNAAFVCLCGA